VSVAVPPAGARFWFWAVGKRLDPLYRPWVAQQITDPRFLRKRAPGSLIVPLVAYVVPQALFAGAAHSRLRLVAVGAVALFLVAAAVVNATRQMPAAARQRLLAHHGVTADGRLVDPVSAWAGNPLGKAGLALFSAQVLIFSSGLAVAADRITAQRACKPVPASDLAALEAVVGLPAPTKAFGATDPVVARGSRLLAARLVVAKPFRLRYAAAYVRTRTGRIVGPAVWRLDDGRLLPVVTDNISAQDALARTITPSTGYGGTSPDDPALKQARDCARAAR